jgi:N-methylhydantoinase B
MRYDPVTLEIYKHLFAAVAEEMGTVLRKSSFSPNIKERRDFSCAIFDSKIRMVAQAAHIPVHLGAMPLSVQSAMHKFLKDLYPGDVIILNDPYHGGTHLPDITMVSPVYMKDNLQDRSMNIPTGFVASRAHHSDVGGITPGSMPLAQEIYQEGLIIPPVKLVHKGILDQDLMRMVLANVRTPEERKGDFLAQMAANQRGVDRMSEIFSHHGFKEINQAMEQLLSYSERMTRHLLKSLPDGCYSFSDFMDDDGLDSSSIPITVTITIKGNRAVVDFSGSAVQQPGSINAVEAITFSAVSYVFRSLLGVDIPNNSGCMLPIEVIAPKGTIVNAQYPAAVAGGNVETSQRIVDVLLGALAQAYPEKIPAASQGTMNNVTIGGYFQPDENQNITSHLKPFVYYETIGGGCGASPNADGHSAIHSHMTNTLNTPIEALEYAYPVQIQRYSIRPSSGGGGKYCGGDGIIREMKLLVDCQVTLLSERRIFAPYGLDGGSPGKRGENVYIRDGIKHKLPSKGTFSLKAGDILRICTPGGGGYGIKPQTR